MADAVNLRHRHPRLWALLQDAKATDWVAVKAARLVAAAGLTLDQARWVDAVTADYAVSLPPSRFLALVEARIIEADPVSAEHRREAAALDRFVRTGQSTEHGLKTLVARANAGDIIFVVAVVDRIAQILRLQERIGSMDELRSEALGILANPEHVLELFAWAEAHTQDSPAQLPAQSPGAARRNEAELIIHVSDRALTTGQGAARVENVGPVTVDAVRDLLRHCHVTVRPVLDPAGITPVDRYEIPARMREAVELQTPFEVFPFGTITSRRADKDHSIPYVPLDAGGPPGQTAIENIAPMGRRAHRIKTMRRGWAYQRMDTDVHLWRTPSGYWFRVDPEGTHAIGKHPSFMEEHLKTLLRAA
jgi:hypothetical protein